jgi:hypothetical protein
MYWCSSVAVITPLGLVAAVRRIRFASEALEQCRGEG